MLCLCLGYWDLLDFSQKDKQSTLEELVILVKIYLFFLNIEVLIYSICLFTGKMTGFFILNKLTSRNVQWPGKLRYLLNNWISWEKHLFWIYFTLQDTWILRRMNPILYMVEMTFSSRTGQPMPTIQENTFFTEHLPVAASAFNSYLMIEKRTDFSLLF